jgi:broad specificity phosphatase PhoE
MRGLAVYDLHNALTTAPPFPNKQTGETREILLIRHGNTSLNSNDLSIDRIRAWKDPPLSAEGVKEAERLGDKIKRNPPDVLVSSDLKRACQTAQIISARTGAPIVETTKSLRPWDLGDFAGRLSKDVMPAILTFARDRPNEPVPGGESFETFRRRLVGGLKEILARYQGYVGLVTHYRVEQLLKAMAANDWDGTVDFEVFGELKGIGTGTALKMEVPVSALQQLGQAPQQRLRSA